MHSPAVITAPPPSAQEAKCYPVLTFSSGPTNSMRGAAFLTKHLNAIVVDIGGTTTDVGVLVSGFPRQSSTQCEVRMDNHTPNVGRNFNTASLMYYLFPPLLSVIL